MSLLEPQICKWETIKTSNENQISSDLKSMSAKFSPDSLLKLIKRLEYQKDS